MTLMQRASRCYQASFLKLLPEDQQQDLIPIPIPNQAQPNILALLYDAQACPLVKSILDLFPENESLDLVNLNKTLIVLVATKKPALFNFHP